jgi:hypothetical protein
MEAETRHEILNFTYNDSGITVSQLDEDYFAKYEVRWTDFIANEWVETYHELSEALARVSALVKCGEGDWQRGFLQQQNDFVAQAHDFFGKVVK